MKRIAALVVAALVAGAIVVACTRTVVLAPPGPPDAIQNFPDGFIIEDAGSGSGGGSGFPVDAPSDGGIAPDA